MTQKVLVYDTTLRDGMQGEGMSLSAGEKLRVAHALDSLGVHLIEAGFPASNPKEEALFELLSRERFEHGRGGRVRHDPPPRRGGRGRPGLRLLADSFAPVCTLVGKTWSLHLEKVTKVDPEENLRMIADSVAFLVARGQARRLRRRALLRRLSRRPRLRAALPPCGRRGRSRERDALRHERLVAPEPGGRGHGAGGRRAGMACRWASTRHDDAGCGVANALVAVETRRAPRAGHDERLRGALRQRQPRLDPAGAGAEARLRVDRARSAARAHRDRRTWSTSSATSRPNPNQPYVGSERLRPQGRHARGRRERRRAHVRAPRPGRGGRRPPRAGLRAVGQGHGAGAGRAWTTPRRRPRWSSA